MDVRLTTKSLAEITGGRAGLAALVLLAASLAGARGWLLGFFRWILQIATVAALFLGMVFGWGGAKPWQIFGSAGTHELRHTAAHLPIPENWVLEREVDHLSAHDTQLEQRRLTSLVPDDVELADLRAWLTGDAWSALGDDSPFNSLQLEYCDPEHSECHTQEVTEDADPRFFVSARLSGYWKKGLSEVGVTLEYAEPEKLEITRGEHFLERHALMPVPDAWVRYDTSEGDNSTGTSVHMSYGIPETDGIDDIEAWLTDTSAWTEFGELTGQGCRDTGSGFWLCHADVDRFCPDRVGRSPYERLSVSYTPATSTVGVQLRLPSATS
ncbi:hypothetical protein GCM10009755_12750 [Brevibacterium samyangense]|uniref:Uncharacterized protein n=1 Tax=Brevibacterium samyangense TaxID=366888 RepID=A0ABP5ETC4_9MICO